MWNYQNSAKEMKLGLNNDPSEAQENESTALEISNSYNSEGNATDIYENVSTGGEVPFSLRICGKEHDEIQESEDLTLGINSFQLTSKPAVPLSILKSGANLLPSFITGSLITSI